MKSEIVLQNDSLLQQTPELEEVLSGAVRQTLAFEAVEVACEVSILLCTDDEIHALNLEYRGKDRATDVLSFPIYDSKEEFLEESHHNTLASFFALGDVVIAPDVVRVAAEEIGDPFEMHLARMCIHSVLHLLGYDHELGKREEKEMLEKQETILKQFWKDRI